MARGEGFDDPTNTAAWWRMTLAMSGRFTTVAARVRDTSGPDSYASFLCHFAMPFPGCNVAIGGDARKMSRITRQNTFFRYLRRINFAFVALTLLIGRQEEHSAHKYRVVIYIWNAVQMTRIMDVQLMSLPPRHLLLH